MRDPGKFLKTKMQGILFGAIVQAADKIWCDVGHYCAVDVQ